MSSRLHSNVLRFAELAYRADTSAARYVTSVEAYQRGVESNILGAAKFAVGPSIHAVTHAQNNVTKERSVVFARSLVSLDVRTRYVIRGALKHVLRALSPVHGDVYIGVDAICHVPYPATFYPVPNDARRT